MKKAVLLTWLVLLMKSSMAQTGISVVFNYDKQPLSALPWYLAGGIEISDLKFYISSFSLWKDGAPVWKEVNGYHLVDASDPSSLEIELTPPEGKVFDTLEFHLGVDSAKSESGIMDGDLDPLLGMYWTWQSGYIHFRLEGSCPVCPPPSREFQLHIGGYRHPYSTVKRILIPCNGGSNLILHVDLKPMLNKVSFPEDAHIMSPGARAKDLADGVPGIFSITAE